MGTTRIPLWGRNGEPKAWALVDEADAEELNRHRWYRDVRGYAYRKDGEHAKPLMHRELMGLPVGDPQTIDHINRNRLDNRRANLRLATQAQQMQNFSSCRGSTSRFRGVWWNRHTKRWESGAQINGKQTIFRGFTSELEAARVVDAWRLENMPYAEPDPELVRAA